MAGKGDMSEAQLNNAIRALCEQFQLYAFSATTYRIPGAKSAKPGSSQGFPDWVIVGPGGAVLWESKSADGRRTMPQVRWGRAIEAAGLAYAVVRPADLDSGLIERELRRIALR